MQRAFHVVKQPGVVVDTIVLEYLSADEASDAERDAMVAALSRRGLRVEALNYEGEEVKS
jgi:hypothetical protein